MDDLERWAVKGMANSFQKGKSSEEMFRELGYECHPDVCGVRCVRPESVDDNGLWTITEIRIGTEEIIKEVQAYPERAVYTGYLTKDEALACAQLFKEMGYASE